MLYLAKSLLNLPHRCVFHSPIDPIVHKEEGMSITQRKQNTKSAIGKSIRILEKHVPPCSLCGTRRIFEFQVLPSLLHVLQVDNSQHKLVSRLDDCNFFEEGGMDWGNIAIYTCSNPNCVATTEEYCVIQKSVDDRPLCLKKRLRQDDAVVQEDAQFEVNDDDDNYGNNNEEISANDDSWDDEECVNGNEW